MKVPARLAAVLALIAFAFPRASAASWAPETAGLVQGAHRRLEISDASRPVRNFGEIEPGVLRGAQPSGAAAYRFLKDSGVSVVMNLRYFHNDDQALCRRYGLSCVRFPILLFPGEDEFFNWAELRKAFAFVLARRRGGRVVFIHCRDGSDRTGVLAAALVIRGSRLPRAELWSQVQLMMREYGFHDVYFSLKRRVRDWIFHPSRYPWICT